VHPRLQSLLPQRALSRACGRLARLERPRPLVRLVLAAFARRYRVDLEEADRPLADYASFTDFFTRRLRPDARPLAADPQALVAPADGVVAACGVAGDGGTLIQAKGRHYGLAELLGSDELAARFAGGSYLTTYLAPRDYHRVHAPWHGVLERRLHRPGRLLSVAPGVVERLVVLPRNERVVLTFDDPRAGPWALVLVGALVVGGIETVWEGTVNPLPEGVAAERRFAAGEAVVERGGEVGLFRAGSTVVALFARRRVALEAFAPGRPLRVGRRIGRLGQPAAGGGGRTG